MLIWWQIFSKIRFRFNQFGGWRLIWAYTRMGVLPRMIKEVGRVTLKNRPLKEAYPAVRQEVEGILRNLYKPLIDSLVSRYDHVVLEHKKNDTVFFCWLQGIEQAPALVKACLASQKRFIRDKDFIVITSDNYQKYITLPHDLIMKYERGIIPHAHFTDLIRLQLLIEHGGTWIDSTVLCIGDNYPKEIMDCEMFFFQYLKGDSSKFWGISNWFMSAYTNNKQLMILRDVLYQYWRDYDCLLDYYVFHLFFNMIAKCYPDKIHAMPKVNSNNALQMVFHLKDAYSDALMGYFKQSSCFHKLDYRVDVDKKKYPNSLYKHIIQEFNYYN